MRKQEAEGHNMTQKEAEEDNETEEQRGEEAAEETRRTRGDIYACFGSSFRRGIIAFGEFIVPSCRPGPLMYCDMSTLGPDKGTNRPAGTPVLPSPMLTAGSEFY